MPSCQVIVQTEASPGGAATILANAWVYWREGGNVTVLRTDQDGRLVTVQANGDTSRPWQYSPFFTTTTDTQAQLFHTRGAKPTPTQRLSDPPDVFVQRTVSLPASSVGVPSQATPVAPASPNTLVATPTAVITIPAMPITLTRPAELSLWPLLWEPVPAAYATSGLSQGADLWNQSGLTVTENGPAAAPVDADRPTARGLRVEGTIAAGVTGVKLQILDEGGNVVTLRQNAADTASVTEIAGTVGAVNGADRAFEATVFFNNPIDAFGATQIVVRSDGLTPPLMASFACQLVGVQIALVADNGNGQSRGAVQTEANEAIIIDFRNSPQADLANISAQTRARRMIAYDIATRQRALSATSAVQVITPEMPMWMAELHLIGLDQTGLEDLLVRRARLPTPQTGGLSLALRWTLGLSWDGPDSGTASPRRYRYNASFTDTQSVSLTLDAQDHIDGANAQGEVPGAFTPAPAQIPFPVANRRVPLVIVNGQARAWGRQAGATTKKTLLVEWQPNIVDGTREVMRGGDGELALGTLSIDGSRVDRGVLAAPATNAIPDASVPTFRVRGVNPPSPANGLIDALVEEYVNSHVAVASVSILSLACWQETVRRILAHEAGHQFDHRGAGRRRYAGQYYGHEANMPIFGGPHGYGYGQHDNPRVNHDGAWSFVENIRESVRRIIEDKGGAAYGLVSDHLPATMNRRTRAVYQRELVRRYNGGTEFRWNGTSHDWEIYPTVARWADESDHDAGANPRLRYPNEVLGTAITYSIGTGAATTFPWPIVFTAASYGPGT